MEDLPVEGKYDWLFPGKAGREVLSANEQKKLRGDDNVKLNCFDVHSANLQKIIKLCRYMIKFCYVYYTSMQFYLL